MIYVIGSYVLERDAIVARPQEKYVERSMGGQQVWRVPLLPSWER